MRKTMPLRHAPAAGQDTEDCCLPPDLARISTDDLVPLAMSCGILRHVAPDVAFPRISDAAMDAMLSEFSSCSREQQTLFLLTQKQLIDALRSVLPTHIMKFSEDRLSLALAPFEFMSPAALALDPPQSEPFTLLPEHPAVPVMEHQQAAQLLPLPNFPERQPTSHAMGLVNADQVYSKPAILSAGTHVQRRRRRGRSQFTQPAFSATEATPSIYGHPPRARPPLFIPRSSDVTLKNLADHVPHYLAADVSPVLRALSLLAAPLFDASHAFMEPNPNPVPCRAPASALCSDPRMASFLAGRGLVLRRAFPPSPMWAHLYPDQQYIIVIPSANGERVLAICRRRQLVYDCSSCPQDSVGDISPLLFLPWPTERDVDCALDLVAGYAASLGGVDIVSGLARVYVLLPQDHRDNSVPYHPHMLRPTAHSALAGHPDAQQRRGWQRNVAVAHRAAMLWAASRRALFLHA